MGEQSEGASPGARLVALARSELGLTGIVAMSLVGLGIATYLTVAHYTKAQLACSTTGLINCGAVTSSAFSLIPRTNIPITIPGMLWFVVSGGLAVAALARVWTGQADEPRLRVAQVLWGALGLLFVLYLVYAEIVVLHKFCEWCTGIHLLTFGIFLVALKRWQDGQLAASQYVPLSRRGQVSGSRGSSATQRSTQTGARRPTSARSR